MGQVADNVGRGIATLLGGSRGDGHEGRRRVTLVDAYNAFLANTRFSSRRATVGLEPIDFALPGQDRVRDFYEQPKMKVSVAVLIGCNFVVSAAEAERKRQIVPGGSEEHVFYVFEWFFNSIFTVELIVNLYANFFFHFWKDLWNVFDFIIVAISVTSMVTTNLPGIGVLRLFRAFRVFRLFKRVKSLRIIIEATMKSLTAVMYAFVVLILVMGIWAIMSVDFFAKELPNEFKYFFRAMLSFFQVMTLDGWCSGLVRPLLMDQSPLRQAFVVFFFVSYVLVNSIMMVNVVVAILLDKFITEMSNEKAKEAKRQKELLQEQKGYNPDEDDPDADLDMNWKSFDADIPEEFTKEIVAKIRLASFEKAVLTRFSQISAALSVAEQQLEDLRAEGVADMEAGSKAKAVSGGSGASVERAAAAHIPNLFASSSASA